ncbi:tRNA (adenosine(37)-N6)-threonylcarbamoyltransferase complex dimerization subunit type 1 TsaB [Salinisphaera sp. USBA-960]|uniref:tRNA (adenosine(37)-N6)-threonylcarbamoyltransferase complex dimerization subunit type 1 TsaB n=1 Tax=Salinisphaera orenii TaxID=856731 RepID=UPI000DBEA5A4|nr:tRNA (adenosine(37)-N6)-threonylcarbamoyltransferase complex dimerization subunit type 1 TsaB [Salifodinibacter halophilus]NNC25871.1 tRNA (adenosine(37)-N6)-threonylcarbamoyltransferase complex dimerization subunit type 1 TsaB [Salifodinibacter halophilus]
MKLLAFDAATEARTVARHDSEHPGDDAEIFEVAARSHGPQLVSDARHLLADAGWHWQHVDAVVFGRGPGAFTGLRIAAGLVQGLATGLDCPVVGIETPRAIARRCLMGAAAGAEIAQIVQDARLGEIYTARYRRDTHREVTNLDDVSLCAPGQLTVESAATACAGGNGWALLEAHDADRERPPLIEQWPHALDLARLAACDVETDPRCLAAANDALPLYVRNEVAVKSVKNASPSA